MERVVFNHLRESLNPFIHNGGPCRGRSFRRRLRQWCRWHGSWNVETTSYLYVAASEYVPARLRRHWVRHRLRLVGLATVICQVLASLRPGTGLYGRLAWPWLLTSPLLRQHVHGQYMYTIVLLYVKICPADCSGWELCLHLPLQDLDVRLDIRLCGTRSRATYPWRQIRPFSSYCWPCSGDTRPGPRLNFSSPPESPMDGLPTVCSGLPTFRLTYIPAYLYATAFQPI